jgi:hypothetical protein
MSTNVEGQVSAQIYTKQMLSAVWSVFNFPAHLYHEACHLLAMFIFYGFIDKINWNKSHFKVWIANKNLHWDCQFNFECRYKLVSLIIISAPIIGWLIGYILLIINHNCLCIYFFFGLNMHFNMSKMDRSEFVRIWECLINSR